MDLHHIREDYTKKALSIKDCHLSPITQFEQWLSEAINARVNEPTAMNIATIAKNGRPSSRMVLLKEVNPQGFVFFTNYQSRKGLEIAENPFGSLTFFWSELQRQVRVEGRIEKIPEVESDIYFASRPYTSRLGAWASEQSQPIDNYKVLLLKSAKFALKFPLEVPRPPHWGGYILMPDCIEFWQGRSSRLHDRIQYRLISGEWEKVRLSP
ncbi:pyridoxamine 5'-phosphate oxidase [Mannheimia varigena]|uniref:pyridoxamine 5'-phosphate oxidase n=1 Tax=Mannheimia varigena TaxID=85404 RepID=UPI0003E32816|nr:pyridoxamine 5'-phosphate oxidase [Mannheimia varigena]AHG78655.1 Pyridoxine/pyridoxamine 5'-phosphate oxidase [Mannheimia varigena USDA-ARS-USMARC-1388]AWW33716.1 pyridoxamine 5'-phosphate oxidase [Mannheimia varigena]MDY2947461.1 pyridoxamine 5'-phosphate oxidase [Mannheimia varigena]